MDHSDYAITITRKQDRMCLDPNSSQQTVQKNFKSGNARTDGTERGSGTILACRET